MRLTRPLGMTSVLLGIALSCPVLAREKTDVLVMKNGDRLTCEVKSLEAGVLRVELAYVDGTISVDWRKVARLESKGLFLVQMQNGSLYSGKMITPEALAGTPAKIEIQPQDNEPLIVDQSDIVRVTQFSESFFRRFSGSLTAGAVYSKGNNATQYNFGSQLGYRQTRWGGELSYNSNLSSSSGAQTSTRNQVDLTAYRMLPWRNYYYAGTAGLLQSSVQEIQRQTIFGIGAGRYLKNSNRVRFSILGGAGWLRTNYVPTSDLQRFQNIAVGIVASHFEAFSFKKTRFSITASLFPAAGQHGRMFSRVNSSYYLKVFGKIDWNLSFYGNWDTQPPVRLPSADYGTSTGISWTFGPN